MTMMDVVVVIVVIAVAADAQSIPLMMILVCDSLASSHASVVERVTWAVCEPISVCPPIVAPDGVDDPELHPTATGNHP